MKTLTLRMLNWLFAGLIFLGISIPVFAVTIQEAFDNAIKFDPVLRASRYNQEINSENIIIARSRLLPQISVQGSSNQLTQTTTQEVVANNSISKTFKGPSTNHQLIIRQALIRPKEISSVSLAELQLEYAKVKYQSDLSDLMQRVSYAWIDLICASQLVEAYKKPLTTLKEATKLENIRYLQGEGTKDIVIEADAQYQLAESMYLQSLESLRAKKNDFLLLTKIQFENLSQIKFKLNFHDEISENDRFLLLQLNKEKSFELKLLEVQQKLQKERVNLARADHLPTLDAIASKNIAKNDATSTQGYQYKNNQIGIQYYFPIYAGGGISAAERQALLVLDSSISDVLATENRLETEFNNNFAVMQSLNARINAGYKLLESSKEQLRAIHLSYFYGVKSLLDLSNAELTYSRRSADQINAMADYIKIKFKLIKNIEFMERSILNDVF